MPPLIFDSHLDLAWNALSWDRDQTLPVEQLRAREVALTVKGRGRNTVSLHEMRRGGVAVCLGTILARARPGQNPVQVAERTDLDHANQEIACAVGRGQLAYYRLLEARGELRIIRDAAALDELWRSWESAWRGSSGAGGAGAGNGAAASGDRGSNDAAPALPIGVILSMEGADPIVSPAQAEAWWDDGLRTASLAHYGQSAYAMGTGFDGPVTPAGRELLREFERLGMVLDLTHTAETAFFEALDCFSGPVFASHNNCRALVSGDRQFSDEQVRRLIERGAVIGSVLDAWMLYPGWKKGETRPDVLSLEAVADQIDHVCQLAGNARHGAIGSDLDGGFGNEQTPGDLDTIADLRKLEPILRGRGYSESDVALIFHGNWLRFFRAAL